MKKIGLLKKKGKNKIESPKNNVMKPIESRRKKEMKRILFVWLKCKISIK